MHKHEAVDLLEAILIVKTKEELNAFLKDLCTPAELRSLEERWKVCQLLAKETLSYR